MDEKQLQMLFNEYAKGKGFKDFGEFKSLMDDEASRKVFFEDSNKELGFKDFNDFNATLGVKKKEPITSSVTPSQLPKISEVSKEGNKKENAYFKQKFIGTRPTQSGFVTERVYENPMGVDVLQVEPKKREVAPTKPVQKAETKDKPLKGVKPIAPTKTELNEQGWLLNMVSALDKGVYKTLGTTVQATGTALQGVTSKITGGTGEGFVSDALIKIGSTYNKYIDELTPQDESFKGSLSDQLGNALGYLAGLYMTGGLSASAKVAGSSLATRNAALVAAKTPPPLATVFKDFIKNTAAPTAIVGGLGMGQSEFDRAKQAGATDEQAFEAFWKNAATGSIMERLPVMHFLKRFNNATAGGVVNYIKTKGVAGLTGGVEEMTTEMLQQLYANKTAKDIYNANQDLFEGVAGNGTIGFSVGFLLNAMGANAKILRKEGKVNEAKLVENQVKELEEKSKGVAPTNNAITTKIAVNGNEEGLQRTQAELDRDLQNGVISEEEYQEKALVAQKAAEVNAKIPDYVQGVNRAESIDLINERENLQQELAQKEEQKKGIDVAYHKSIDESNKEVQKRIDEINNQLGELAKPEKNKAPKEEVVVQEEIQQPIEDKKADIEKRREQELKERVVYDVFPTVEDGEFKIVGDPNNRVYRINENTGRPQELDPSNGLWSNTALSPNLFMESTKRSGFEKLKENINAKYDAELNALGEQQIPDENIQLPIEEQPQGEIVEAVRVEQEPEAKEGWVATTLSGMEENERAELVEQRRKDTALTEEEKLHNDFVDLQSSINSEKSRSGKNEIVNKIRQKVRVINAQLGSDVYKFDGVSVRKKNKKGVYKKVTRTNKDNSGRAIKEDAVLITDRDSGFAAEFEKLTDSPNLEALEVDRGDKTRMTKQQIEAAYEDAVNGVPSVQADNLLNVLEEAYNKGYFEIVDRTTDPYTRVQVPFNEFLGVQQEEVGQPMDEEEVLNWLNEIQELPQEEQIEIDNIILEYEQQPQQIDISGKVQSPKPESKEGSHTSPKPSEEGKGNGSPKEKVGGEPIAEAKPKENVEDADIFYHSTNKNFEGFDDEKIGTNKDFGWFGLGHYFTSNKEESKYYGKNVIEINISKIKDKIYKVVLENQSIKIPKSVFDYIQKNLKNFKDYELGTYDNFKVGNLIDKEGSKVFSDAFKNEGYLGVRVSGDANELVIFESKNIPNPETKAPLEQQYEEANNKKGEKAKQKAKEKLISDNFDSIVAQLMTKNKIKRKC